jgi:hypothetical protein
MRSLVKSFCGGQERIFLTFFPKSGNFEPSSCIQVATARLLGRAKRSSPNARKGCATLAQGLDGASARRAIIGRRANASVTAEVYQKFFGLFSPIVRRRSSVPKI